MTKKTLSLLTLVCAIAGCQHEECSLDTAKTEPRAAVNSRSVVLKYDGESWIPEKILQRKKWHDLALHKTGTGVVELYESSGKAPTASKEEDGPEYFEGQLLGAIPDLRPEMTEAKREFLKLAPMVLNLPESEPDSNGDAPFVKWTPFDSLVWGGSSIGKSLELDLSDVPTVHLAGPDASDYETPEGVTAPYPVEAVHWSGDPRYRMNLIILPDGFTEEELPLFKAYAQDLVDHLLTEITPYSDYKDNINVIRLDAPSVESGADCDDGYYTVRENRYGSSFPVACLNATFGTTFNDVFSYQLSPFAVLEDSGSVFYEGVSISDQVLVIINSEKYGAGAIAWANQTTATSVYTAAHEMGHSITRLGDEYLVEGSVCQLYMGYSSNLSIEKSSISKIKWGHWIENNTPIPTPDEEIYDESVGFFQGGGQACTDALFRPSRHCRMNFSEEDFCSVCHEAMILRFYDYLSPIEGVLTREGTSVSAHVTRGEKLQTQWFVDGKLAQETSSYQALQGLSEGEHEVELLVFDAEAPVRKGRCEMQFSSKGTL